MNQEGGSQIDPDMNRYSSVSSVVQRMSAKISKDRQLRKSIEKLRAQVNMSQE